MKIITTSWDDGNILDFKLAELLSKYNLQGTFYIPKKIAERKVMELSDIVLLAKNFEIGGHTLDHLKLNINNEQVINQQVQGSFDWLKELLGYNPVSFSFPYGKFNNLSIAAVANAGFKIARTTELLALKPSNNTQPTTIQVHEHSSFTYVKHLFKRRRWFNLIQWLQLNSLTDLLQLSEAYLSHIINHEGCFHLWGHSWEIQEYGLWTKLEEIFKLISNHSEFKYLQNKELAYQ